MSKHLSDHLDFLKLEYIQREHRALAEKAARETWSHGDYLDRLVEGEVLDRRQRALERRLRQARFPYRKTLEQYQWSWPKKINAMAVKELFTLGFLQDHKNVVVNDNYFSPLTTNRNPQCTWFQEVTLKGLLRPLRWSEGLAA